MKGLLDLDILEGYSEEAINVSDILTEFKESMNELSKTCMDVIGDPESTEEDITEATALAKQVHSANDKSQKIKKQIGILEKAMNEEDDEDKKKALKSKMCKLQCDLKESVDPVKPGDKSDELGEISKKMKKMCESFDQIIEEASDLTIPVPGGLSEKPAGAPKDDSIPVPNKTEITADQYNSALAALQKSFKEGADIIAMLQNVNVVESETDPMLEAAYDKMAETFMEQAEDGAFFESVNRKDKGQIKDVTRKIRKKLVNNKIFKDKPVKFLGIENVVKRLVRFHMSMDSLYYYQWQTLGYIFTPEKSAIKDLVDELNKAFEDELGEGLKIRCSESVKLPASSKTLWTKILAPIGAFMVGSKGGNVYYAHTLYIDKAENPKIIAVLDILNDVAVKFAKDTADEFKTGDKEEK